MSTTRPVLIRFYVERSKLPWDVNYFKGHDGHDPRKDPHLGVIQNHHGKFDLPVFVIHDFLCRTRIFELELTILSLKI